MTWDSRSETADVMPDSLSSASSIPSVLTSTFTSWPSASLILCFSSSTPSAPSTETSTVVEYSLSRSSSTWLRSLMSSMPSTSACTVVVMSLGISWIDLMMDSMMVVALSSTPTFMVTSSGSSFNFSRTVSRVLVASSSVVIFRCASSTSSSFWLIFSRTSMTPSSSAVR